MLDLLRKRRSIRKFKNEKMDDSIIGKLKEALVRSPTSRNLNPWEFIIVDDKKTLEKLSLSKEHGSSFLKGAPMGIVICGDSSKSDVWVEDCSIASIIVQLTSQSLGLGSCWIQIRNRNHNSTVTSDEYVKQALNIPGNLNVESIIAIGHPDEKKPGVPEDTLSFNKIRMNNFT